MRLYYFQGDVINFGDDINPWFWEQIFPSFFDQDADVLCIGIGTLLNHRLPASRRKVVLGSGVGYGDLPSVDDSWDFFAVRGPLSANKLGIDPDIGITDPAAKLPELYPTSGKRRHKLAFMPHVHSHRIGHWDEVCKRADIYYIDPTGDCFDTIDAIAESELLITEAMHGAIVADAYRIPWIPAKCDQDFLDFKWRDWGASLELDVTISALPLTVRGELGMPMAAAIKTKIKRGLKRAGIWQGHWGTPRSPKSSEQELDAAARRLQELAAHTSPTLSQDHVLASRLGQLDEAFSKFRDKYISAY